MIANSEILHLFLPQIKFMSEYFKNKTVAITGGSDGIGKALIELLLPLGAKVATCARNQDKLYDLQLRHSNSPLHCVVADVSVYNDCKLFIDSTITQFGGIDILINNASAISLTGTEKTEAKRFDLMYNINVRGTFLITKACIPYLKRSQNAHILTLSPPINMDPKWFDKHVAYTLTKYNMSMMTVGWAAEFKKDKIAANSLWPRTTIDTAAVRNLLGGEMLANMSRKPEILSDSAYYILRKPSSECTGNLFVDEDVLANEGITDLSEYSVVPGAKLYNDLFV
jgi:NAD(P)-dependent dehydrogenase (short-subunit alcohol dehydrogenase family)